MIAALIEQPIEVRGCVEEVSIDMWGGFDKVIALVFPNAKIVSDRFYVIKPFIKELNKIANQVGIKGFDKRGILLLNRENLTEEQVSGLNNLLSRSSRLRQAYEFKEDFREIYETS